METNNRILTYWLLTELIMYCLYDAFPYTKPVSKKLLLCHSPMRGRSEGTLVILHFILQMKKWKPKGFLKVRQPVSRRIWRTKEGGPFSASAHLAVFPFCCWLACCMGSNGSENTLCVNTIWVNSRAGIWSQTPDSRVCPFKSCVKSPPFCPKET